MKSNILFGLIITLLFCNLEMHATAPTPDILMVEGKSFLLFANPLASYPSLDKINARLFQTLGKGSNLGCEYVASWLLKMDKLYLINIRSCDYGKDNLQADLKELFGDKCIQGVVFADWFTGNIQSPRGNHIHSDSSVSGRFEDEIYERSVEYHIKNGIVEQTVEYDNSKSKESAYSKGIKNLSEFLLSHVRWDQMPVSDSIYGRVIVQFSGNELGVVDSVRVVRGINHAFDVEAVRVVKLINDWDVFYKKGKFERYVWNIAILFNMENKRQYGRKKY